VGAIDIPDDMWFLQIELPDLHSFQEFVANEVVGGS
jgi:hypothetical protein